MGHYTDKQWQQDKTDEVSGFEQSSFYQSSTFDSRLSEGKARQRRPARKRRQPSWVLVGILMVVLAGVALLKVLSYLL